MPGGTGCPGPALAKVNDALTKVERSFLIAKGLPGRPWFKHAIYAPGLTTGYASWTLPGVRQAIIENDAEMLAAQLPALAERIEAATAALKVATEAASIGNPPVAGPPPPAPPRCRPSPIPSRWASAPANARPQADDRPRRPRAAMIDGGGSVDDGHLVDQSILHPFPPESQALPRPFARNRGRMSTETTAGRGQAAEGPGADEAFCVVVGSVIGSGIFIVPSGVAKNVPFLGGIAFVWIVGGLFSMAGP